MTLLEPNRGLVSAIVPARNEDAVIAACVESLAQQKEIAEILVVNDQSADGTAETVRELMRKYPQVQLLEAVKLPTGWVGKNNAVWLGARRSKNEWLLFTDADAVHEKDSVAKALEIARRNSAVVVSLSPEQMMETWYEKALIPYVYCRLSRHFSYDEVNDPQKPVAAMNGQFVLINRPAYEAVGGHASVAGEVLEDVALAKRLKSAGYRIWFGSGKGIVRVRMYRTFGAMWQGWRKNLYQLMGRKREMIAKEFAVAVVPVMAILIVAITIWGFTESLAKALTALVSGLVGILVVYNGELKRNQFPLKLLGYGIPGRLLYAAILLASQRSHAKGKLEWKGREYPVRTPGASKDRGPWQLCI
jgi:cellulose synthase/poly-beta-1,6-N-acetylglucosamine synthase-like glycosyltransferase